MMDRGQRDTYRELTAIEKRINREYAQAIKGIEDELFDYLRRYQVKDKRWREWVESGEKTVEEYQKWRTGQMAVGKRWADQKEVIANQLFEVNKDLREYIRKEMPQVYADNFNYATYKLEKDAHIDTGFNLYNKEAVERIIGEDADVLKGPGRRVKGLITRGKAVAWDKKQLQSVMIQGILQGDSIPKLAERLATTVGVSDEKAAIRYARTMATGSMNAGRVDAYKRAESKGVEMVQRWVATEDNRTRHSHRWLNGEERPVGEAFSNGCEYPGDPKGDASEIYNCRCCLRGVVKGLERQAYKYKDSTIDGMSYDEWLNAKPEYNPIMLPKEKAENIAEAWRAKYRSGSRKKRGKP